MSTRRVLLADDHALFAEALAKLLSRNYEVVGVAASGRALLESFRVCLPDVVVTDITMPLLSGLDCARRLRRDPHKAKIVFLTMHVDPDLARECFKCGGSAFVVKECAFEELVVAIEAAMENRRYLSRGLSAEFHENVANAAKMDSDYGLLTSRQEEILQLFAEGKTAKEIASLMNLSTRTIEWYKYNMMRLLRIKNSAELLRKAVRLKLVV
ncbi:MAG TPA: response regulator transcription factor [Terriglobia bacterium]